uniref:BRF1 domain-containing protein n=1 Tax=Echinostoma caproni TaxID=27848 RepID=A0A183BFY1_9TREM
LNDEDDVAAEREMEEAAMDSWSAAINYQASLTDSNQVMATDANGPTKRPPRIRKAAYFSDEEEIDEADN